MGSSDCQVDTTAKRADVEVEYKSDFIIVSTQVLCGFLLNVCDLLLACSYMFPLSAVQREVKFPRFGYLLVACSMRVV